MTESSCTPVLQDRSKIAGIIETVLITFLILFFTINSNNFVFYFFAFLISPLFLIKSQKGDEISHKIIKNISFLLESKRIFRNTIALSVSIMMLIYSGGVLTFIFLGMNNTDALLWPVFLFMGLVAASFFLLIALGSFLIPILDNFLPRDTITVILLIGAFISTYGSWLLAAFFCYCLFIIYANIIAVVYFFGIFLTFLAIRFMSTILSLITSPIEAMASMPVAYREQLSKSVVLSPYVLLPGSAMPKTENGELGEYTSPTKFLVSSIKGAWHQEVDFGFQAVNKILFYIFGTLSAIIATLVFFLPAMIWRILLKGTSIFFLPLLMIPNLSKSQHGIKGAAEQILTDLWSRASAVLLLVSHLLIPLALATLGTVIEFSNLSPEAEIAVGHLFALISVWDGSEIKLDGIARLISVFLVFGNFFLAKRVLSLQESNPQSASVGYEKIIIYASTAQAFLTIYWLFIQCARAMFEIRMEVISSFLSRFFEELTSISLSFELFPVGP